MRRFSVMSFVGVVVLIALAAGMAVADPDAIGTYYWPPGTLEGTCDLKVEEDATVVPDGAGWYNWSYTVTNLNQDGSWAAPGEDVAAWGFNMPGIGFEYVGTGPTGWTTGAIGYDVGWTATDPGQEITWIGGTPGNPTSLDSFFIRSKNEPHMIYTGTATGDSAGTVSGDVSGPTPEPITMALLALGLPLGLLARRRKED